MPNYCWNKIRIENAYVPTADGEDYENAHTDESLAVAREAAIVDLEAGFNAIVPRPESLDIESGSTTTDAVFVVTGKDPSQFFPLRETREEIIAKYADRPVGKDFFNKEDKGMTFEAFCAIVKHNLDNYGFASWYEWSIANWGTKWDLSEFKRHDGGYIDCEFTTAWSPPGPVLQALANKHRVKVVNVWDEEGGNRGNDAYEPKSK